MATLIIYMSRHGTTEKIATLLAQDLKNQPAEIINLRTDKHPDLSAFDQVIIGGSIHIGQIQRRLKSFCKTHEDELMTKKLGLFICYMLEEKGQEELENAFPEKLREHATATGLFGGEFVLERMNQFERFVIKKAVQIEDSVYGIHEEAVDQFIEEMNAGVDE